MDHITVPALMRIRDLASILRVGTKALYLRLQTAPSTLPPRFILPGSNLLLWHPVVVQRWINERAGLIAPTTPPPAQDPLPRRRPGRPTKREQIESKKGVVR